MFLDKAKSIRRWKNTCRFVICWINAYWFNLCVNLKTVLVQQITYYLFNEIASQICVIVLSKHLEKWTGSQTKAWFNLSALQRESRPQIAVIAKLLEVIFLWLKFSCLFQMLTATKRIMTTCKKIQTKRNQFVWVRFCNSKSWGIKWTE